MHKLSICIPTFNRANLLKKCLDSIEVSLNNHEWVEVCISDNASTDNTISLVENYKERLPIVFSVNSENIGLCRNILKVSSLASGNFIWLVGDDDCLMPDALDVMFDIMHSPENKDVEFFYNNAFTKKN